MIYSKGLFRAQETPQYQVLQPAYAMTFLSVRSSHSYNFFVNSENKFSERQETILLEKVLYSGIQFVDVVL